MKRAASAVGATTMDSSETTKRCQNVKQTAGHRATSPTPSPTVPWGMISTTFAMGAEFLVNKRAFGMQAYSFGRQTRGRHNIYQIRQNTTSRCRRCDQILASLSTSTTMATPSGLRSPASPRSNTSSPRPKFDSDSLKAYIKKLLPSILQTATWPEAKERDKVKEWIKEIGERVKERMVSLQGQGL